MKILLAVVAVGAVVIATYVGWQETHRSNRRSALEDRAGRLRRDTAQAGEKLDSAKARTDSLGSIVGRDTPRSKAVILEVLRRDTLTDTIWMTRAQVVDIQRNVEACELLALACKEERTVAETRAAKADSLAMTNRALYLNEKKRRWLTKGTQVGIGGCVGLDGRIKPCGYVGYGFSLRWP